MHIGFLVIPSPRLNSKVNLVGTGMREGASDSTLNPQKALQAQYCLKKLRLNCSVLPLTFGGFEDTLSGPAL